MVAVALAARITLACTLLYSGVAKVTTRARLDAAVPFVPQVLQPALALGVPIAEMATAIALVALPFVAPVAWVAVGLFAVFTAVVVRVVIASEPVPCNCFGSTRDGVVDGRAVVRNGWLLALAVAATGSKPGPSGLGVFAATVTGLAVTAFLVRSSKP